ncbi:MAG: glutathione S-transferase family protein [Symploca sp. SIO1C4]|uniref:Glutathione S-transferase family protein n=1 Tax=Symploca sp. SIO1C4 TaxID=2607765 RepID=A0A6B3N9X8_9CYAN|nr:glutathione S-transferase family protein [Symploca sp. SIO1C4]
MAEYKLYWHPLTSSFAPHAILEEIGLDYEAQLVNLEAGEHKTESFLKVNPNGLLPALLLGNGCTMYESAGMVMYLADKHPEAAISPLVSDKDRHLFNQWLFYLSSMIYQTYTRYYYWKRFSTDPIDAPKIREKAAQDLGPRWQVIDDALKDKPWLIGERFSACDIYMQMMTIWHIPRQLYNPDSSPLPSESFFDQFKNITRTAAKVSQRPAVKKIIDLYPPEGYLNFQAT